MIIEGRGVFLSSRKLQESGYIAECLLENHGLVRGYTRLNPKYGVVTPGCIVKVVWKARLDSHLGYLTAEIEKAVSPMVSFDKLKNLALGSAVVLVGMVLHEREVNLPLYKRLESFLIALGHHDKSCLRDYALFEAELLAKSGFGLDLSKCAVTNTTSDLVYVSPKTGRAVSRNIGIPYHEKLFLLPEFLHREESRPSLQDISDSLKITGHFFAKHVWHNCYHDEPVSRIRLRSELMPIPVIK